MIAEQVPQTDSYVTTMHPHSRRVKVASSRAHVRGRSRPVCVGYSAIGRPASKRVRHTKAKPVTAPRGADTVAEQHGLLDPPNARTPLSP